MANKQELSDSFDRQSEALPSCCQGAGGPLGDACLGVSGRRMILANRVSDWHRLADESPTYDPVIAELDASSDMLETADDCEGAVDAAMAALDGVEALLDAA